MFVAAGLGSVGKASGSDLPQVALWHIVPKFHLWEHIADTVAPQLNPGYATCYADEDIVGRMAKLAKRSHRAAVARTLLGRWRTLLAFRLRRR